jgi:hypothetical protein
MWIEDGSLLDEANMNRLYQWAQTNNMQLWIERVSKDTECTVILEDGALLTTE